MPTGLSLPLCPKRRFGPLLPLHTKTTEFGESPGWGGGGRGGRNLWDRGGQPALGGRLSYHAHGMGRGQCHEQLTQEPCNFIGLLLLNSLIVEDFKENVQHQDVLPVKGLGEEVQVTSLSLTGGDLSKLPSLNLSLHP